MRNKMEQLLKSELRVLAIMTRERLDLTQKEMADKFNMTESSYSDIETGKYMCGTLTAILLLTELDNPNEFLQHLSSEFTKLYKRELLPI